MADETVVNNSETDVESAVSVQVKSTHQTPQSYNILRHARSDEALGLFAAVHSTSNMRRAKLPGQALPANTVQLAMKSHE